MCANIVSDDFVVYLFSRKSKSGLFFFFGFLFRPKPFRFFFFTITTRPYTRPAIINFVPSRSCSDVCSLTANIPCGSFSAHLYIYRERENRLKCRWRIQIQNPYWFSNIDRKPQNPIWEIKRESVFEICVLVSDLCLPHGSINLIYSACSMICDKNCI